MFGPRDLLAGQFGAPFVGDEDPAQACSLDPHLLAHFDAPHDAHALGVAASSQRLRLTELDVRVGPDAHMWSGAIELTIGVVWSWKAATPLAEVRPAGYVSARLVGAEAGTRVAVSLLELGGNGRTISTFTSWQPDDAQVSALTSSVEANNRNELFGAHAQIVVMSADGSTSGRYSVTSANTRMWHMANEEPPVATWVLS